MRRIKALIMTAATLLTAAVLVPAQPAMAAPASYDRCRSAGSASHSTTKFAYADRHNAWSSPFTGGVKTNDTLRFTAVATDTYTIDFWGNWKYVDGEGVAPSGAGWPLPGARQFALIAKVDRGRIWLDSTDSWLQDNRWFSVRGNSGCFYYDAEGTSGNPVFTFAFNDPKISDNSDGTLVSIREYNN